MKSHMGWYTPRKLPNQNTLAFAEPSRNPLLAEQAALDRKAAHNPGHKAERAAQEQIERPLNDARAFP